MAENINDLYFINIFLFFFLNNALNEILSALKKKIF